MGCDIHGWVEYRELENWYAAISTMVLGRNYDMFACLFGVRNYANFRPVVESRGLPEDVSLQVEQEYATCPPEFHNANWLTWHEIQAIDLNELAEAPDSRAIICLPRQSGQQFSKAAWERQMDALLQNIADGTLSLAADPIAFIKPQPFTEAAEPPGRMTRRAALGIQWIVLTRMMAVLAERYGDDNVRLVVWFDS